MSKFTTRLFDISSFNGRLVRNMIADETKGAPSPLAGEGEAFSKSLEGINTILLLGSGALRIGEAGEFDYSGSQAIKA